MGALLNITNILNTIQGVTNMVNGIKDLVEGVGDVMTSDDRVKVSEALSALQAANDTMHARVSSKLEAASKQG